MQNNLLDYLDNIVKTKADKLAYSNGEEGLTFKNVNDIAKSIGTFLLKENAGKKPIAVFMEKHPNEIATFFGCLEAGAYYVPIDAEMPEGRIQLILDNIQTPFIICDEHTIDIAKGFKTSGQAVLFGDIANTQSAGELLSKARIEAIDTDPVYIVFTSGSTGIPKGVAACHRSVIDYIEQLSETLGFNEDTVFGNQTPLYFDACLKELYPTLKFGATTYLIPKSLFMMPVKLVEYLNEHKINTICWVVSALTMVSAFGAFKTVKPEYLKTIAFGSEVFPIKQFNAWKEAVPNAKFTNLYGPTEGTGMCCYFHVDRDFPLDGVIPIGKPFKNREILLLTDDGKLAEDGQPGEICIRGNAITLGYYNNPEKTRECYVQNPLNKYYPEIIYKTGDIAKKNENGELIFVSRKDYQIKHMGHRIELGEIEVNVNMLDGIKLSGCIYDNVKGKIVLYYVGSIDEKELTVALKEKLPRYMLPNKIIRMEEMPLTANGKINRVELKKLWENN